MNNYGLRWSSLWNTVCGGDVGGGTGGGGDVVVSCSPRRTDQRILHQQRKIGSLGMKWAKEKDFSKSDAERR